MKILVTGVEGFIGRHFCQLLSDSGHQSVGIDKKAGEDVNKVLGGSSVIEQKLSGIHAIVHLAANCSTPRSIAQPIEDFQDNAQGTLTVLEYARQRGLPVIYTSTCKVYSAKAVSALNGACVDETISVTDGARTPYGTSKLVGELYCEEYAALYGVKVVIDRLSSVFGIGQHGTEEAGWLHWFIRAKKRGLPITIYGSGEQVRDVLWVNDLCRLLLEQVEHIDRFAGQCVNVGGGKENAVSLNGVVAYLNRKGGPPLKVRYAPARPADLEIYISDMRKLFRVCPWRPTMPVERAIDLVCASIPHGLDGPDETCPQQLRGDAIPSTAHDHILS